jgi:hypothetical protein
LTKLWKENADRLVYTGFRPVHPFFPGYADTDETTYKYIYGIEQEETKADGVEDGRIQGIFEMAVYQ